MSCVIILNAGLAYSRSTAPELNLAKAADRLATLAGLTGGACGHGMANHVLGRTDQPSLATPDM
jgi:hypothetical protein